MVRVCDGNTLPAHDGKVYMLRSYANSAHEIWDVTDPGSPVGVRTVAGGNPVIGAQTGQPGALAGTHKSWWECDTGIAYLVGRRGTDSCARPGRPHPSRVAARYGWPTPTRPTRVTPGCTGTTPIMAGSRPRRADRAADRL